MSTKGIPVTEISMNAFCHATEDLNKVKTAMMNLIPESIRSGVVFSEDILEGYYGNVIVNVKLHFSDKIAVNEIIDYLRKNISDNDKRLLYRTLDYRLDESCVLHIRFDKGAAYNGVLRLNYGSEVIKVTLKFNIKKRLVRDACIEIGLISGE
ncbi:MAG: hypothetical protein HA488_00440 [Candidatus Verstraetearchaeota archaeon]|nr:hypothetical protein [Candidatus Verstraetearchaeota archaeon]